MLKLKELRLSGIGRFVEKQTIKFDTLGNLVQVDADNMNTGGSSGSGKTTLFNATDYLFGVNDVPANILQSRLTKSGIDVEGDFDWDGKPITISRSKKGLKIDLGAEIIEGSNKLAEEKLDQIIGMPRDLFRKMLHKRQKEGGFFLALTPKEVHEFLTDCLGLTDLRSKIEIIDSKVKELQTSATTLGIATETKRSALKATQDSILSLGLAPVKDMHKEVVIDLKAKADKSAEEMAKFNSSYQEVVSKHDKERIELSQKHKNEVDKVENAIYELGQMHKFEFLHLNNERPNVHTSYFDRSAIEKYTLEQKTLENKLSLLLSAEISRQSEVKEAISKKLVEQKDVQNLISQGDIAKEEAIRLAGEIKQIRAAICPTCEQCWTNENAKVKENQLLEKVKGLKSTVFAGETARPVLEALQAELLELSKQVQPQPVHEKPVIEKSIGALQTLISEETKREQMHISEESAKNNAILAEFAQKQTILKQNQDKEMGVQNAKLRDLRDVIHASQRSDLAEQQKRELEIKNLEGNQLRGQADVDQRAFEAAAMKLRAYEDARVRYETALQSMKAKEAEYQAEVDSVSTELKETEEKALLAVEVKKAINSYISCSFDDALEIIGETATRIIRAIPNMANATIQLEGIKETAAGKIKEEVNAVISMDGEIGIPIKSLSGGERSSVDLAVDLAVIDLIESKSNKGINLFILDEPFTGLDTVSIEMALEILKNSNINKKLIIVDHNPEVKEMVESRLVVVRDGQTSTVRQGE